MKAIWIACALLAFVLPTTVSAQGINSNVALPVAEGEVIWRSQLRYVQATDDPSPQDREVRALLQPQTLVYGLTPRFTAFSTLPILTRRWIESDAGGVQRDSAIGDLKVIGRYTFFADDYAALSTRRVALIGGVKFPTGSDRFGTPTFDPILGAVGTWAANRHELDADLLYTIGTKRHDFETGDRIQYDLAYRYRLWPKRFGRRLLQVNGLVELNGRWAARSREDGSSIRESGEHVLFLSPGVQIAALRWILEASVQFPVAQDLNGPQTETDFVGVLSVRIPFEIPWK